MTLYIVQESILKTSHLLHGQFKLYICDRICENQPSGCTKIALFFQLCLFITTDPFEITDFLPQIQNLMENLVKLTECIPFRTGDIHCYVTTCNLRSDG